MRVLIPGHKYELQNVDDPSVQVLQFVQRRDERGELLLPSDQVAGLQTQEVLRALIDRTLYLHAEQAWHENVTAVNHLRDCLRMYESRAAHRHLEKLGMPERAPHCLQCGHIFCFCSPKQ